MKKIFLVIILLFFIGANNVKFDHYSYLINDDSYSLYSLYVEGLNTKNFLSYFSDINVIKVYPYINPVYKKIMGDFFYKFESSNLSFEINTFKRDFFSFLKKNSYFDYNYLYLNGISIDRVDVYINGNDLYKFLNNSNLIFNVKKITDCCV